MKKAGEIDFGKTTPSFNPNLPDDRHFSPK